MSPNFHSFLKILFEKCGASLQELVLHSFNQFSIKSFKDESKKLEKLKHLQFVNCLIDYQTLKDLNLLETLKIYDNGKVAYVPTPDGTQKIKLPKLHTIDIEFDDKYDISKLFNSLNINLGDIKTLRIRHHSLTDLNTFLTNLQQWLSQFTVLTSLCIDLNIQIPTGKFREITNMIPNLEELGILIYSKKDDYKDFICSSKKIKKITVEYAVETETETETQKKDHLKTDKEPIGNRKGDSIENLVINELHGLSKNIESVSKKNDKYEIIFKKSIK